MNVIELKNVSKIYQMGESEVHALDGVDLKIKKGEFVAIYGPSGSGKSTMMHIVGCLDLPSKGKVFLESHDISKLSESELAVVRGKKIGFIFQTFNLIPTLTVLENVTLPLVFQDITFVEREKRAKEILEIVGLGHRIKYYPNKLSGGERQRVAISRALVVEPEIILADEPTGNIDSKTGKKIMETLEEINNKGKTIIMVTHDPTLASYANKIVYLKDGKVERQEIRKETKKAENKPKTRK